jgi:hypothetical protein
MKEMLSLYDFLKSPAGANKFSKQVAGCAYELGVETGKKWVETNTFQGYVKTYPVDFLQKYFYNQFTDQEKQKIQKVINRYK